MSVVKINESRPENKLQNYSMGGFVVHWGNSQKILAQYTEGSNGVIPKTGTIGNECILI